MNQLGSPDWTNAKQLISMLSSRYPETPAETGGFTNVYLEETTPPFHYVFSS